MKKAIDSQALCALIGTRRLHALRDALARENKVDIARFLGELAPEQAVLAFRTLPKDKASDVFSELGSEMQQAIIASVTDAEIAGIMEDLATDDAVDMLEEMPANIVKACFEKHQAGYTVADQSISEISGNVRRQHDDGRISICARI